MTFRCNCFLVKVFLKSLTDENGKEVHFDPKRIKVSLTEPIVRLVKLSKEDLEKALNPGHRPAKVIAVNPQPITHAKKRKHDKLSDANNYSDVHSESTITQKPKPDTGSNTLVETNVTVNQPAVTRAKKRKHDELSDSNKCPEKHSESTITMTKEAKSTGSNALAKLPYSVDEVVFTKLKGFPHWPSKILRLDKNKYEVYWFKDYRTSMVFHTQIFKFLPNYKEFTTKYSKNLKFMTAVKEAIIFSKQKHQFDESNENNSK